MIDVVTGGALVDKTPKDTQNFIPNMDGNTQLFFTRQENVKKKVDISNYTSVEQQLSTLTNIIDKLVQNNLNAQVKSCGICLNCGHMTDACETLKKMSMLMLLEDFLDNHKENIIHIQKHIMKDGKTTLTLDGEPKCQTV